MIRPCLLKDRIRKRLGVGRVERVELLSEWRLLVRFSEAFFSYFSLLPFPSTYVSPTLFLLFYLTFSPYSFYLLAFSVSPSSLGPRFFLFQVAYILISLSLFSSPVNLT